MRFQKYSDTCGRRLTVSSSLISKTQDMRKDRVRVGAHGNKMQICLRLKDFVKRVS